MIPELKPTFTPAPPELVISRPAFLIILVLAGLVITGAWLAGLPQHHTLWHNAIGASLLMLSFFLLPVVAGLYTGIRPRCRPGKITSGILPLKRFLERSGEVCVNTDLIPLADSLAGFITGLLLSFLLSPVSGFLFWLLHAFILCVFSLLFHAFSRVLMRIFRHRYVCKGNLAASIGYGLGYTLLYSSIVFCLPAVLHYFIL